MVTVMVKADAFTACGGIGKKHGTKIIFSKTMKFCFPSDAIDSAGVF